MNCDAGFRGIMLSAGINGCAHRCRYCLVDERDRREMITFERFAAIAEKFVGWKEANTDRLNVFVNMRYSYECTIERFRWFIHQRARCGQIVDSLLLGGLRKRTEADTTAWLTQRRDAGIGLVIASLAGPGAMHDFWNGRLGDFEHLLLMLRCSAQLGMQREERLFLTKSSLPVVGDLIRQLDELPEAPAKRAACLFMYRGRAAHLEDERISVCERDAMPENIRALVEHPEQWRSEAEWIDFVMKEAEEPRPRLLHLGLTEETLASIGGRSCEEIVADMEERTRTAYAAIPTRKELCEEVGDPTNQRIYPNLDDIERLWLDRFIDKTSISFERSLTHLSTW
jgi:hypothetical protein